MTTRERIHEIAQEAAPLLTGAWRFNRVRSQAVDKRYVWTSVAIISDDSTPGRAIRLRRCWRNRNRFSISGEIRGSAGSGESTKRITVDASRESRLIAGDINRRLIPAYLEEWKELEEQESRRRAVQEKLTHRLNLVKRFCPDLRPNPYSRGTRFFWNHQGHTSELEMYSGDDVRLGLRISFDEALRIIAQLKEGNPALSARIRI